MQLWIVHFQSSTHSFVPSLPLYFYYINDELHTLTSFINDWSLAVVLVANVHAAVLMAANYLLSFSSFVFGMAGHVSGKSIPPNGTGFIPCFSFTPFPFILDTGLKLGFVWRCICLYTTVHTHTGVRPVVYLLYIVPVIHWSLCVQIMVNVWGSCTLHLKTGKSVCLCCV